MITPDHLDQAAARVDELTALSGYPVFSGDWFEVMATEAGLEPMALQAYAIENTGDQGRVKGLLTGVLAQRYATEGAAV